MKPIHVSDYLWNPAKVAIPGFGVLFGDESYLKHLAFQHIKAQVLDVEDAEFSLSRFEGTALTWTKAVEELTTVAMFGGRRLIVIEDADSFVKKYREQLEDYAKSSSTQSVLLLLVSTFPATTKLYKKLVETGLLLNCTPLKEGEIPDWIVRWAQHKHHLQIERNAAELLLSYIGPELGLLEQELAKLSLLVSDHKTVDVNLIEQSVGSLRVRTTFEMLDLALSGKTIEAIRQLNALLISGENPIGILAQIAYSIRKLASATRLILQNERERKTVSLATVLEQVGVNKFFIGKMETQLKQLGRVRGQQLSNWLLQIDLDLKGASRSDPRLILEVFLTKLSSLKLRNERVL
ncbi:MAG: DNA polymerase III subunit delta [Thermoguttaceae bacterium]